MASVHSSIGAIANRDPLKDMDFSIITGVCAGAFPFERVDFRAFSGYILGRVLPKSSTSSRGGPKPETAMTIIKRVKKDGTASYRAEVRIKKGGAVIFQESASFASKRNAEAWRAETYKRATAPIPNEHRETLGELIGRYIAETDRIKPVSRCARKALEAIAKQRIAAVIAVQLSVADFNEFALSRSSKGAGPATITVDLVAIAGTLRYARAAWNIPINLDIIADARTFLRKNGLINRGKVRNRRPTDLEIDRLLGHFRLRMQHSGALIPMADIVEFAIYSCMRQGEICRITWNDLDEIKRTIVVRDRKDPEEKIGNDQTIPLLGPAWEIVQRQPQIADRIFPYREKSVSSAFTRTCQHLGIEGLRFHDLRREGASRLIEMGYSVPEVASVTGHKNFQTLWAHYTQIKPETLHAKFKGTP